MSPKAGWSVAKEAKSERREIWRRKLVCATWEKLFPPATDFLAKNQINFWRCQWSVISFSDLDNRPGVDLSSPL